MSMYVPFVIVVDVADGHEADTPPEVVGNVQLGFADAPPDVRRLPDVPGARTVHTVELR